MGGIDSMKAVNAAIVALLEAEPSLTALVGAAPNARIAHGSGADYASGAAWPPYVVFTHMGDYDVAVLTGTGNGISHTIGEVQVVGHTRNDGDTAEDLQAAIHTALQGKLLVIAGKTSFTIQRVQTRTPPPTTDEDGNQYHTAGGLYKIGVA